MKTNRALGLMMVLWSGLAAAGTLTVEVETRPVGSFKATSSTLLGHVQREGEYYSGHDIKIAVAELKTGNALRDRYLKALLKNEALAFVDKASGQNGVFTATLKFRGLEKSITGPYRVEGFQFIAQFPLKLSEYGFEPIEYIGVKVLDEVDVEVSLPILSQVP